MPESEAPERQREIERAFDRLSAAVDRAAAEVEASRERARSARAEYERLRTAVGADGDAPSGDMEERLARLTAENRALREVLSKARERAERLKSRLWVVEDEV